MFDSTKAAFRRCEKIIAEARWNNRELTPSEREYLSWVGYTGPGRQLVEIVKAHNEEVRDGG